MPQTKTKSRVIVATADEQAVRIVEAATGVAIPRDLVAREKRLIAAEKKAAGKASDDAPAKNPAAVLLGRMGGLKGGKARAESLTPARRRKIAQLAVQKRWEDRDRILNLTTKGVSAAEIAAKLGIPVSRVRKAREAAVAKLKEKAALKPRNQSGKRNEVLA
jgi:DNA-directed RNA polymerase specialized sigma24 family protein